MAPRIRARTLARLSAGLAVAALPASAQVHGTVHAAAGRAVPGAAPDRSSAALLSFGFEPGERVADARFTDVAGAPGVLSALAGKAGAVIVVRDAECPVSQRYAPRLAELEKAYGPKGYTFAYVDVTPHDRAAAKADAAKYGLAGRTVLDEDRRIVAALRATSSAEAFVVDRQGTLRYRGAVDDQYGIGWHKDAPTRRWLTDALDRVAGDRRVEVRSTDAPGCALPVEREAAGRARPVTYHNRISRIIQEKCESCHRAGGMAPMPLQSYKQVYDRRAVIAYMTKSGRMPPWGAAKGVGSWANDVSLSERELADLQAWVKAGAPAGSAKDAPLPRTYAAGWNIGRPDAVVQIPDTFRVPAQGVVEYKYSYAKTDFDEDKWITAMEIRPTAGKVVHHVLVFLEEPGRKEGNDPTRKPGDPQPQGGVDGFFAATAPGATGVTFPAGHGKRLPKGAWLKFQIHYQPNGTEQVDRTQIGFAFADRPLVEVQSRSAFNTRFAIPPGDPHYKVVAERAFRTGGTLLSLFPHMHLRGGAFRFELVKPDSTVEMLLDVPRFDFNWQSYYELKTPLRIEPGSRIRATAWYDNSRNNPFNPDPTKTVRFGEQTFEEMMIGYFDFVADVAPPARADSARKAGAPR